MSPAVAAAAFTDTTVSLSTSSAVSLLQPTSSVIAASGRMTNEARRGFASVMEAELQSHVRDRRAQPEIVKWLRASVIGHREWPAAPGAAQRCRSARADTNPARAARSPEPAEG